MVEYNSPRDLGYKASDSYASLNLPANNYGLQSVTISLPIYNSNNEDKTKKRSKCPRGAKLGEIGSCCGWDCTRACALSDN